VCVLKDGLVSNQGAKFVPLLCFLFQDMKLVHCQSKREAFCQKKDYKEQSKRNKAGNNTCNFLIAQLIANSIKTENETEEYIGRAETFNFCLLSDHRKSTHNHSKPEL